MTNLYFFLFAFIACLSTIGCHKKEQGTNRDHSTMRLCLKEDPNTIDPRKNGDPGSSMIIFMIYEGLVQIRANGEAELALAESVEISEDGKVYTFRLKESYWNDGHPVTAHDFEYSWKKIVTPEFASPCPYLLYAIKNAELAAQKKIGVEAVGVHALDDKTLRIELENPTPYFLSLITFCNFYPVPKHIDMSHPSWEATSDRQLVSCGPYNLVRWDRNKEIVLQKNPTYWNKDNIHLDEIRVSIVANGDTALHLFESGELDFLTTPSISLSNEALSDYKRKGSLEVEPIGGLCFCTFNLERFPFSNIHIRKALSCAIDRKMIADYIAVLSEKPATRIIPPILENNQNRELILPFEPEEAQTHLEQGLRELGVTLSAINESLILTFESTEQIRQIAQSIQEQWKRILKLEATLMECDKKTILSKHMGKDYYVGLDHCYAQYHDPNNILERFKFKASKKNLPGFENKAYIALLDRAARTHNPEERLAILDQAEGILIEEMPLTPILYLTLGHLASPAFTNIEFSPIGNLLFKKVVAIP